jgi:hypothetical protein
VPVAAWRIANAICSLVNFDFFMPFSPDPQTAQLEQVNAKHPANQSRIGREEKPQWKGGDSELIA